MPAASVVLSLLTFFRPVKKASLLSGRVPAVLVLLFVISNLERDLLMKQISLGGRNDIEQCHNRRVPARQPASFSLESRKENEPKETA